MRYFRQGLGKTWVLPNEAVRGTAARLQTLLNVHSPG